MPRPTTDPANGFVKWLKDELRRKNMTRQQLCDLSGVDSALMSRIVSRDAKLTFETALLIAPYLELDEVPMLVQAELIDPPAGLTVAEVRLLQAHRNLNGDGQETLSLIGESLQEKFPAKPSKRGNGSK